MQSIVLHVKGTENSKTNMPVLKLFGKLGARSKKEPQDEIATGEMEANRPIFPPEIIRQIVSYIGDVNVLLECRLVCKSWNLFVCELLEERSLSHWWNLKQRKFNGAEIVPVSPVIEQRFKGLLGAMFRHVSLPPPLETWEQEFGNPFPSKSLTISRFPCLWGLEKPLGHNVIKWDILFRHFGHFLTSVNLIDAHTTETQLKIMLGHLINLKALTINSITVTKRSAWGKMVERTRGVLNIKAPISLSRLEIFWYLHSFLARWLLTLVEEQLITLTVRTWNPLMEEICKRKFGNLKQLHILTPDSQYLAENWQADTAPFLQNLTIMIDIDDWDLSKLKYTATFIAKFSSTLTTLCINAEIVCLTFLIDKWVEYETKFQMVSSLTLKASVDEKDAEFEVNDWNIILSDFRGFLIFPALVSVKFKQFEKVCVIDRGSQESVNTIYDII